MKKIIATYKANRQQKQGREQKSEIPLAPGLLLSISLEFN